MRHACIAINCDHGTFWYADLYAAAVVDAAFTPATGNTDKKMLLFGFFFGF